MSHIVLTLQSTKLSNNMTTNSQTAQQTMDELFNKRDRTGDATFIVGPELIKAHRCVLAAISPKYEAQFFGPHADIGHIRVPNVSADAFTVFLEFFYKSNINLSDQNVEEVLDLAKQSLVDKFVDTCVRFLKSKTTAQNVCWTYGLAVKYDLEALRASCVRQIQNDTNRVFASGDFLHCSHAILLDILKMDSLACTETDVFNACIAWARSQCKQNNLDDGNPKNLRTMLDDAVYQIRFASMNATQSAALHKSVRGLFTSDETVELFYIVGKVDAFISTKFNQKPRSNPTQTIYTRCSVYDCEANGRDYIDYIDEVTEVYDSVEVPDNIDEEIEIQDDFHASYSIDGLEIQ